jgi:HlyD family secretion protein
VLAVVGDRVEVRRVATGLNAEGFVEVTEGLKAGEAIVARAGSFLRDGDVVRAVEAAMPKRTVATTAETR